MGRRPPISTTKDTLFRCTTLFRCRVEGKYGDFKIDESSNLGVGYGPILKPYQQPYPPIFSSILSPNSRSAFVAGERGWSIMSANFAQAACIKTHWDQYALGCESVGRPADRKFWRKIGRAHV